MSITLFEFVRSFVDGRISAPTFSDAYTELWRIERDSGLLQKDEPRLSECLSSVFCATDMYCADSEGREVYELDEDQLKSEVLIVFRKYLTS